MNVLALYQSHATASLDELARLCGFPGKPHMNSSKIWAAYQAGEIARIRNDCETGVVNTYLVYLHLQQMRGALTTKQYAEECALVRITLDQHNAPHGVHTWPPGRKPESPS